MEENSLERIENMCMKIKCPMLHDIIIPSHNMAEYMGCFLGMIPAHAQKLMLDGKPDGIVIGCEGRHGIWETEGGNVSGAVIKIDQKTSPEEIGIAISTKLRAAMEKRKGGNN